MSRHIKRGGRIWIRIFPDKPVSQKPAEVRMGNGKGNPEYFVAEIQPGKILYEMDGVTEPLARQAFALAAAKLPFIKIQRKEWLIWTIAYYDLRFKFLVKSNGFDCYGNRARVRTAHFKRNQPAGTDLRINLQLNCACFSTAY